MELKAIVDLWKRSRQRADEVYLATVVLVRGSSYRKPGARMLVTASGERAGTISGGCLEGEVTRKIAWLTANGPVLESYRSSFDDDHEGVPYGLGCGGTIWILMERGVAAEATLNAMERALETGESSLVVSSLSPDAISSRVVVDKSELRHLGDSLPADLAAMAIEAGRRAMESGSVAYGAYKIGDAPALICLPIVPPPHLHIFGAGDDAQPLSRMASELGWQVTILDGRSHLLKQERFTTAKELVLLQYSEPSLVEGESRELFSPLRVQPNDLAVIMTHSYEQDRALLRSLLPLPIRYLGILGPLHRTERLVESVAVQVGLSPEDCLEKLHAPVGLAIGSSDPASIALSILAEMQAESVRTAYRFRSTRRNVDSISLDRTPDRRLGGHAEVFENEIALTTRVGFQ